jgi:acyl-CoA synthetase (AMP-forming)/AMP-acid ligase II
VSLAPKPQRLLHEALTMSAARGDNATKVAVVVEGKPYTYGELLEQALRLAAALRARGVARGDRVAIYMDNTWPCIVSLYGALLAGGVFVIVNPQTKSDKVEFILNDSGARLLLTDGHLSKEFLPALPRVKQPLGVIASGKLPTVEAGALPGAAHDAARQADRRDHPERSRGAHLHLGFHGQPQGRHADAWLDGVRGR